MKCPDLMNIIHKSGEVVTVKYNKSLYNKIVEHNHFQDELERLKDKLEYAELTVMEEKLNEIKRLEDKINKTIRDN